MYRILPVILIFLVIAGCGGECKVASDCTNKKCFDASCEDKACVYDPINDCCGNKKCETAENKCTCGSDCGICEGKVEGAEYISMFCNQANECLAGLDQTKVKAESLNSGRINSRAASFELDADFNQPFNIDSDRFFLTILLTEPKRYIQNIVLKKIEVIGETSKRQKITLGEKLISRSMWNAGQEVMEELYLDPKTNEKESKLKNVQVVITLAYDQGGGTKVTPLQASFAFKLPNLEFVYVNPDTTRECPAEEEWDDSNNGTNDICSSETNYFVEHIPIPGVCGNFECDERQGENRCNCPEDCGECTGDIGNYMELLCDTDNNCISMVKVNTETAPKTIFDERRISDFKINSQIKYQMPFDVSKEKFSIEFETSEVSDSVSDITLEKVRILEGDNLLMEKSVNQAFGSSPITISDGIAPTFSDYEKELSIQVGVWYKWVDTKSGEQKYGNHAVNLGKITFLNPG